MNAVLLNSSVIVLLFFAFLIPALAQEIPVNVKADDLQYVEESGLIEARGSVEVEMKEVTIYADFLQMDPETNVANAQGHVKLVSKEYLADAATLSYDADDQHASFNDFRARLFPAQVKGPLYVKTKKLEDLHGKMLGDAGQMTTCDKPTPHYFAMADRVEYYPDEKIIAHNVTLYEGNLPVFWLPYVYYDLNKKRDRNWSFGHNGVEGNYLKTTWGYDKGTLYLDAMEQKGFGIGTRNDYDLLAWGAGTLYLYQVGEKDLGQNTWIVRVNHTKDINPYTKLKFSQDYTASYLVPAGRQDYSRVNLGVSYAKQAKWNIDTNFFSDNIGKYRNNYLGLSQSYQGINTAYAINYNYSLKDPSWMTNAQNFSFSTPLAVNKSSLKLNMGYDNNVQTFGGGSNERLHGTLGISGKETSYGWQYTQDWFYDLDGNGVGAGMPYEYVKRNPEIIITPNAWQLKPFTLSSSLGVGNYREVKYVSALGGARDFTAQRGSGGLNAKGSFPVGLGSTLGITAGLSQYLYSPGDQFYTYNEGASLNTSLGGIFRNTLSYSKGSADGNSPFLFDKQGSWFHFFRENMTFYNTSKFSWNTNGGFNWQNKTWDAVITTLELNPTSKFSWKLATGWDIENRVYKDLVNGLLIKPRDFFSMELAATNDLNSGILKTGSVLYDVFFLKDDPNQWRVKFSQVFDSTDGKFKVRDIMVLKDLHCWQLKYTYSDYRKEFSFTFSLKALPEQPIGYSTGGGLHFDGFEKELKKLINDVKTEDGNVQRY